VPLPPPLLLLLMQAVCLQQGHWLGSCWSLAAAGVGGQRGQGQDCCRAGEVAADACCADDRHLPLRLPLLLQHQPFPDQPLVKPPAADAAAAAAAVVAGQQQQCLLLQ
jgi:hypothetical protein